MPVASITRALAALLSAAVLLPAQAAVVEFSFSASVASGPFSGQVGSGFIRFDNDFVGDTVAPGAANGGLEIDFSFMGQSFDESNDQDFPDAPFVTLSGGLPVGIDFLLTAGASGVAFNDATITGLALQGALLPGNNVRLLAPIEVLTGQPNDVPEPASLALATVALLGLGLRRRTTLR